MSRSASELRALMATVPNDDLRERFLDLAERAGRERVALAISEAAGWAEPRDGGRPQTVRQRVRGVEVALGLAADKFGATRPRIRAYRVVQFSEAMDRIEAALDAAPKMPGPRRAA